MTIKRTIRKRIRRYALYCLMAATSVAFTPAAKQSFANETHDSSSLCAWGESGLAEHCENGDWVIAEPAEEAIITADDIHFFAVDLSDTLQIDTCNYDTWLKNTLETKSVAAAKNVPAVNEMTEDVSDLVANADAIQKAVPSDDRAEAEAKVVASASRTSSAFNQTMAAIAAAASAGNPLPFGQWTEPFAMVGPDGSHSLPEIQSFQDWFNKGKDVARQLVEEAAHSDESSEPTEQDRIASNQVHKTVAEVASSKENAGVSDELDLRRTDNVNSRQSDAFTAEDFAAANQEPSTGEDYVPLVDFDGEVGELEMVETTQPEATNTALPPEAIVFAKPSFIGASPVIATIEEAYAPYDLVESDREPLTIEVADLDAPSTEDAEPITSEENVEEPLLVWAPGVLPSLGQPFCVRSLAEFRDPGWGPLEHADVKDYVKATTPPATSPKVDAVAASPAKEEVNEVAVESTATGTIQESSREDAIVMTETADEKVDVVKGEAEIITAVDQIAAVVPVSSPHAESVESTQLDSAKLETPAEIARRRAAKRWEGSADCLLDELIWKIGVALEEESVTDQWLRPKSIGKHVATLVVSSDEFASRIANELALVWPVQAAGANQAPQAGVKLLAEAEASESGDSGTSQVAEQVREEDSAESTDAQSLAQATATLLQWVDAAQSVIDGVSVQFDDVIEVARNRGTQDDSTKR